MTIYNIKAPALPLPTPDYDQRQQDQFQSALRLYFNRLDQYNSETSNQTNSNSVLIWMNM
jgi:hypothetical protein